MGEKKCTGAESVGSEFEGILIGSTKTRTIPELSAR